MIYCVAQGEGVKLKRYTFRCMRGEKNDQIDFMYFMYDSMAPTLQSDVKVT